MNNHQKNSILAAIKQMRSTNENTTADLLQAVIDNDHRAMLASEVYRNMV